MTPDQRPGRNPIQDSDQLSLEDIQRVYPVELGTDGEVVDTTDLSFESHQNKTPDQPRSIMRSLFDHHESIYHNETDPHRILAIPLGEGKNRILVFRYPFTLNWHEISYLIATSNGFALLKFPLVGELIENKDKTERDILTRGGEQEIEMNNISNKRLEPVGILNNLLHNSLYPDQEFYFPVSEERVDLTGGRPLITLQVEVEDQNGAQEHIIFNLGAGNLMGDAQPITTGDIENLEKYFASLNQYLETYDAHLQKLHALVNLSINLDQDPTKKKRKNNWRIVSAFRAFMAELRQD